MTLPVTRRGPLHTVIPVRTYTIDALLAEGFTRRMIRRYRLLGVLPPAVGRGPSAYYLDTHIRILREIKRAKDENRSLADIKDWASFTFPQRTV
jgi:DNA-binding transcriptional MerR regulator